LSASYRWCPLHMARRWHGRQARRCSGGTTCSASSAPGCGSGSWPGCAAAASTWTAPCPSSGSSIPGIRPAVRQWLQAATQERRRHPRAPPRPTGGRGHPPPAATRQRPISPGLHRPRRGARPPRWGRGCPRAPGPCCRATTSTAPTRPPWPSWPTPSASCGRPRLACSRCSEVAAGRPPTSSPPHSPTTAGPSGQPRSRSPSPSS
jgi:hypothetical protein